LEIAGYQEPSNQFQVTPYTRPELDACLPELLKCGDVISLHHEEIEAKICYSRANGNNAPFAETVAVSAKEQTSSNGLWRIESPTTMWAGDLVFPSDDVYMFKHIATGLYLACNEQGELHMTLDYDSLYVQWSILPFKDTGLGITCEKTGMYMQWRGESRSGGFWMVEGGQIDDGTDIQDIDSCKKYSLSTVQSIDVSAVTTDVISITRVDARDAEGLMLVRRCVAVMRAYTDDLEKLVANAKTDPTAAALPSLDSGGRLSKCQEDLVRCTNNHGLVVLDTLTQLILSVTISDDVNPKTRSGEPLKEMQDVLFEQNYMELIIKAIKLPFDLPEISPKSIDDAEKFGGKLIHICSLIHCLLRGMCKHHIQNQLKLFEDISLLLSQV